MESADGSGLVTGLVSRLEQRIENLEIHLGNAMDSKITILAKLKDLRGMVQHIYVNSFELNQDLIKVVDAYILKETILNDNDTREIETMINVYNEDVLSRLEQLRCLNDIYRKEFCANLAIFNSASNKELQSEPIYVQEDTIRDLISEQEQLTLKTLVVIKKHIELNLHKKISTD